MTEDSEHKHANIMGILLFGSAILLIVAVIIGSALSPVPADSNDPYIPASARELSPARRAERVLWRANAAIQKRKHEANITQAESIAGDFVAEHFELVEWLYVPGGVNQYDAVSLGGPVHTEAYVAEGTITGTDKLGDTLHPVAYEAVLVHDGPAGPDQNWRMVALMINGDNVLPPFETQ